MMLPVHGMILEHLGYPLDIGRDLGKFDYTQVSDLLNNHGEAIGIILYQAKWIFFFFFLITVFLTGGLTAYFFEKEKQFNLASFLQQCINKFGKFLRLNIYFLIFHLLLIGVSIFLYQKYLGSFSPFEIENDTKLVKGVYIIGPIYLFLAITLQAISDVAKYKILGSSSKYITQPIKLAFSTVFRNLHHVMIFLITHFACYYLLIKLYGVCKHIISVDSSFGFWILIILGQLFILMRVGLRLTKFAGWCELERDHLR